MQSLGKSLLNVVDGRWRAEVVSYEAECDLVLCCVVRQQLWNMEDVCFQEGRALARQRWPRRSSHGETSSSFMLLLASVNCGSVPLVNGICQQGGWTSISGRKMEDTSGNCRFCNAECL